MIEVGRGLRPTFVFEIDSVSGGRFTTPIEQMFDLRHNPLNVLFPALVEVLDPP